MLKTFLSFLRILIPFTVALFLLQYFAVEQLKAEYTFYYNTWSIYLFHFLVTLTIFVALGMVKKTNAVYTGYAFLASSLLKMMASVVFLIPLIKLEDISKLPDVIAFFIPYFLFLFLETFLALKLINTK